MTVGSPPQTHSGMNSLILGLVRLRDGWQRAETLSIQQALDSGDSLLGIGTLVLRGSKVLVPVETAEGIWVVAVDLASWTVTAKVLLDGRYIGGPSACLASDGTLAVVWSRGVDLLDAETLRLKASLPLDDLVSGVACAEDRIWIPSAVAGRGTIVDTSGSVVGSFEWDGTGSTYVIYDRDLGAVLGTDQDAGAVFRCETRTGRCRTTSRVGAKPTDLLVVGSRVVVTLEVSTSIGVVEAESLAVVGTVPMPGRPRGLALGIVP